MRRALAAAVTSRLMASSSVAAMTSAYSVTSSALKLAVR
jgi:hypothetical protein